LGDIFGLDIYDAPPKPTRGVAEQMDFMFKDGHRLVFSDENFVGVLHDQNGQISQPLYPRSVQRIAALADALSDAGPLSLFVGAVDHIMTHAPDADIRKISEQARATFPVPQMAIANPVKFVNEVRAEVAKVVWPTRREVVLTTIMVFIMAALTAVFFSLVDLVIRSGLTTTLGYFGS